MCYNQQSFYVCDSGEDEGFIWYPDLTFKLSPNYGALLRLGVFLIIIYLSSNLIYYMI